MKLLSVQRARSVWFIRIIDLNPHGLNELSLIEPIKEKYNFRRVADIVKPGDIDLSKGFLLGGGSFKKNGKREIIVDLTIYNDGFVVDTRSSTDDSDAFLEDFLNWIAKEYGFEPYKGLLRSKIYLSELWVQTDIFLNNLNPKLVEFANRLTTLVPTQYKHSLKYETAGIIFGAEPTSISPLAPFKFERAENTPYGEKRYFSVAPLRTEVHLTLLNELENIIAS